MEKISDAEPGMVLGRYELEEKLGEGSFGVVYRCRDAQVGNIRVALKLFSPKIWSNQRLADRIKRELFIALAINHDNVVKFYEPFSTGEFFGYSMEYVDGFPLDHYLGMGREGHLEELLDILCQICLGLEAIHKHGIVHRDLKPSNVLITKEGVAKISDFGLATTMLTLSDDLPPDEFSPHDKRKIRAQKLTLDGEAPGTPDYISPELIEEGTCDIRSDVYALGVIAWELYEGTTPFHKVKFQELLKRKVKEEPPPLCKINHNCPVELSKIIHRALRKEPALRYQTPQEMRTELVALLTEVRNAKLRSAPESPTIQGSLSFLREGSPRTIRVHRSRTSFLDTLSRGIGIVPVPLLCLGALTVVWLLLKDKVDLGALDQAMRILFATGRSMLHWIGIRI